MIPSTAPTDFQRLVRQAFRTLRSAGYFARMHWTCCQSCGWAGVPEDKSDRAVFFHAQDAENYRDDGYVYLAWGGNGHEIAQHFEAQGLRVEWDGSGSKRLKVEARQPGPSPHSGIDQADTQN